MSAAPRASVKAAAHGARVSMSAIAAHARTQAANTRLRSVRMSIGPTPTNGRATTASTLTAISIWFMNPPGAPF